MNIGVVVMARTTKRIRRLNPSKFHILPKYSHDTNIYEYLLNIFCILRKNIFFLFLKVIKRLTDKLDDAQTFTDPLDDTAFEYGFNTKRLKEVLSYWKGQYLPKWGEREAFLNQFQQFTTQIQG